jgi:hypothetical protein
MRESVGFGHWSSGGFTHLPCLVYTEAGNVVKHIYLPNATSDVKQNIRALIEYRRGSILFPQFQWSDCALTSRWEHLN